MSRLVDESVVLGNIHNAYEWNEVRAWLKIAPTVDAVPVVRCKDCKECEIDEVFHDYWCNGRKVWRDHYCACGERRTDE